MGRGPQSGCLLPDFDKRLAELLQHVYSDVVDKWKSLVAPRHDPLQYSTESEVAHLAAEVRDTFSRDVRADRMAAAQASLEWVIEMQPLRDEFAGDAITFDAALEEMRSCFEQKSGTFARKFDDALSQGRFPELRTLLLGSRDLKGAAE